MRHLELSYCKNLKSLPEGMNALLPSLECLMINSCEKLESFPEGGLPANLQSLQISSCNDKLIEGCWQVGFQTLDALRSLILIGCGGDKLNCFPFPPALTTLKMRSFENMKFMNCKDRQCLTHLSVFDCPNLESFLQQELPSSTSVVKTETVVETRSFQQGGFLPNLQSLEIEGCNELIGRPLQWGLQRFNALSHLTFSSYKKDDLSSFPEDLLLPSTLISLNIDSFEELEVINYKDFQHLTSLSKLRIYRCKKLRCFPEEGVPSSLSFLEIYDSDLLKARCEREKGQDWLKISHISHIWIDGITA